MSIISRRRFLERDQAWFAELSGDSNPIHVDPAAARRTQIGAPIVHGMHTLLWALDQGGADLDGLTGLRANFVKPVYVGEEVSAIFDRPSASEGTIRVFADEALVLDASLEFGRTVRAAPRSVPALPGREWPPEAIANDLRAPQTLAGGLAFASPPEQVASGFGAVGRSLGAQRVAALACISRLVGMVVPGLHSILASVHLHLTRITGETGVGYDCDPIDPRFGLATIEVWGGGIAGSVTAFCRGRPVEQARITEISGYVGPNEFSGATALVVGGSRGLGEVAAKILAAGGAKVFLTYVAGAHEAERVAREISTWGGACAAFRLDVRKTIADQIPESVPAITHMYYFATGPIFVRRSREFERDLFSEFIDIYVSGFVEVCRALRPPNGSQLRAFYPSSTAVAERPRGMTEYAMAKAAGEVICQDLNSYVDGITVETVRLPRLKTDQTATVRTVAAAEPLDVLLGIVRMLQA